MLTAKNCVITSPGFQVWQGSLLLCDHILHNANLFTNRVVLELGGGVGLASVAAAMVAKLVFCTGEPLGLTFALQISNVYRWSV